MASNAGPSTQLAEGLHPVSAVDLRVDRDSWLWAQEHEVAILANFERRKAQNPGYFNGRTFILAAHSVVAGVFRGSYAPSRFADYLYWRDQDFPECGVRDGFGSAILRSSEGHILLGRQAAGNVNAGSAYLPGGFIDQADVQPDGRVDIDGSIMREITEETGLEPAGLVRSPGYRLSVAGPLISIGIEFWSALPADAMRKAMLEYVARDAKPELDDIVIIRRQRELEGANVPDYTRHAVTALLAS